MEHGRVFVDGGFRVAIVKQGPKWAKVVFISDHGVIVHKVKGIMTIKPIPGYTNHKLACVMLRRKNSLGCKRHISKPARHLLEEAKAS
jgi:hypothetical protein